MCKSLKWRHIQSFNDMFADSRLLKQILQDTAIPHIEVQTFSLALAATFCSYTDKESSCQEPGIPIWSNSLAKRNLIQSATEKVQKVQVNYWNSKKKQQPKKHPVMCKSIVLKTKWSKWTRWWIHIKIAKHFLSQMGGSTQQIKGPMQFKLGQ